MIMSDSENVIWEFLYNLIEIFLEIEADMKEKEESESEQS